MSRHRVAPWVVTMALLAACGNRSGPALSIGGERVPFARLTAAVEGLCQARQEAGGDLTGARATFYDRAHETLHTIARALEPVDRAQAARLLEAKQAVEADFGAASNAVKVAPDLDRLIAASRASLSRLEIEAPPCS